MIDLAHLPPCVGLYSAEARSGKSTVASVLVDKFGYHELRFSDPIRQMWRKLLDEAGFAGDILETLEESQREDRISIVGMSYREFAEMIGGNARIINPDVWVNIARDKALWLLDEGQEVVFSDMRYPNEFRMIKELSGVVVEVVKSGFSCGVSYPSQGRLSKYQFDISLSGHSVEELKTTVEGIFSDRCNGALRPLLADII